MIKKIADRIFRAFCHEGYYIDIKGDLEEIYGELLTKHPRWKVDAMYIVEVSLLFRLSLLKPFIMKHEYVSGAILKNYFLVTIRQLSRNKTHSLINIMGLSIGFCCCILITLYIIDELDYDRFHEHADRIYRINSHSEIGGNERYWALAPSSVGPALKANIPEVETYTRVATLSKSQQLITFQESVFDASTGEGRYGRVFWADSNFFQVFSYEFLEGDPERALNMPNGVVITEREAVKIFGKPNVLGETLEFSNLGNRQITGVIDEVPSNSHLQFDYLLSHDFNLGPPPNSIFWARVYILMHPQTEMTSVLSKLDSVARQAELDMLNNGVRLDFWPTPVHELHLTSNLEYELYPTNDAQYIYIFSAISVFILLIASINFVNLSTAQLSKRAHETGIRKVLGAGRKQIGLQFLVQSVAVTLLALFISILLSSIVLGPFNTFIGKSLSLTPVFSLIGACIVVGVALGVGFMAGMYPAITFSAFSPMAAMKQDLRPNSVNHLLRKVLVVFQFAISVTLITATFLVVQQLYFLKDYDLGFEQDQILAIRTDRNEPDTKLRLLRNQLSTINQVEQATLSSGGPGKGTNVMVMVPDGFDNATAQRLDGIYADFNFVETYGLKIIAGRNFDPALSSDSLNYIINRSAMEKFGWTLENAVGRTLKYPNNTPVAPSKPGKIIGILDDFHYASLHNTIGPLLIAPHSSNFSLLGLNYLSIKFKGKYYQEVLNATGDVWNTLYPGKPLDATFLDLAFEKQYKKEERLGQIISLFATLAIMIACLGLFGLAIYVIQQRTKEIGIRKVLGASVAHLVSRLSRSFVWLIVIGNLIAWPVAYLLMKSWLEGFAYHIEINPVIFIAAGLSTLSIALLTIGYQTVTAAQANPVRSLRHE